MKRLVLSALALIAASVLNAPSALAFPEMIRHGYTNCVTCHVNPGGSGVLTEYGRQLSREVQSTWGGEDEAKFAFGLVKTPEWLGLMGEVRGLQVVQESGNIIEGRPVFMQGDLEGSVNLDRYTAVGSIGLRRTENDTLGLFSRRHFAMVRLTDEAGIRAGKFDHVYGLMPPEHRIATRSGLGWDIESETYNLEASWIGERLNAFATAIFGRPDDASKDAETGASASVAWAFSDTNKAGWSLFAGSNDQGSRWVTGPFATLSFSPSLYWLVEADLQSAKRDSGTETGFYQFQKFGWEAMQGLHFFVMQDYLNSNLSQSDTAMWSWGPGIDWFPRPHWEVQLSTQWTNSTYYNAMTWLGQLNFYL